MLVDAYGSDSSDNNSGDEHTPHTRSLPRKNKSTSLSLPVPSHPSASGSSNLTHPAPRAKRAPKKIVIDLPALPKDSSADDGDEDARPAKKPRTDSRGAGSSALFSMLPAPTLAAPVKAAPERILGGGKISSLKTLPQNAKREQTLLSSRTIASVAPTTSLPFMPESVRKGKANVSLEDSFEKAPGPSPPAMGIPSSLGVSSAPQIEEFIPPEPTPDDPYPGYFQRPSGAWEPYDPTYYQQFYNKWKADYDREVRALEKREKGFEGADADDTQEVNALREMEKAKKEVQEREEKKALTQGAGGEPAEPRMNIKVLHSILSMVSGLVY